MRLSYTVTVEVDIPNDRLQEVIQSVKEKFELDDTSDIIDEDLLIQAEALGIITLPSRWLARGESFSQIELAEEYKTKKSKTRGKRK